MRVNSLLPLLPVFATAAIAAPSLSFPDVGEVAAQVFNEASEWVQDAFAAVRDKASELEYDLGSLKTEMINVKGIECECEEAFITHRSFGSPCHSSMLKLDVPRWRTDLWTTVLKVCSMTRADDRPGP